ncbi:hypothetical protein ACH429_07130 [Streptomyces pathocidini]|uniref:Uncharacterized protein n=1 Tax=Streptomyces pathocidini TaxID=1650571 RepID=A0ABW7UR58_9ACTN|nr:hypothetical protein [Streptomyces pathocidini]
MTLQRQRQLEAITPSSVQVFDRSPVCTHALATYLGRPVSPALAAELERITSLGIYERQVLFVRNLGFCEPTTARRICLVVSDRGRVEGRFLPTGSYFNHGRWNPEWICGQVKKTAPGPPWTPCSAACGPGADGETRRPKKIAGQKA